MARFGSKRDEATDSLLFYCQESLVTDQSNLFQVLLGFADIVFTALRGEDESFPVPPEGMRQSVAVGMWYLPNSHSLPRTFSIQHICCCLAAETYRQNPLNTIPAYFLFESLFSHPEETVVSREGNDLKRPFIFYIVCLIFLTNCFQVITYSKM